jgi:3-(3-hydroxy-phenyl)propionate hydroxylase/6-hydroxy-3-succinoylpyridine 3-monooxygenase
VLASVTPFPYNIQLGQDRLAEICLAGSRRCPTPRCIGGRRSPAVAGRRRRDRHAPSARRPIELRARWVIGADGAGSAVRKALGLASTA